MKTDFKPLPEIEEGFVDEFGAIDPDVYTEAQKIWPQAERLAEQMLFDGQLGLQLLMKAVARVTAARNSGTEITNLRFYLLRSFKNLLLAELEKENGRGRLIQEHVRPDDTWRPGTEDELNRKILINELRLEMDDWMREVFDLMVLGYTFEELVPRLGSASNVIRSKFSKKLLRLSKSILHKTRL